MEQQSVLVPAVYDVVWVAVALLGLGTALAALVAWVGRHGRGPGALAELALVVLVPVLGPLAYLLATRGRRDPAHHRS